MLWQKTIVVIGFAICWNSSGLLTFATQIETIHSRKNSAGRVLLNAKACWTQRMETDQYTRKAASRPKKLRWLDDSSLLMVRYDNTITHLEFDRHSGVNELWTINCDWLDSIVDIPGSDNLLLQSFPTSKQSVMNSLCFGELNLRLVSKRDGETKHFIRLKNDLSIENYYEYLNAILSRFRLVEDEATASSVIELLETRLNHSTALGDFRRESVELLSEFWRTSKSERYVVWNHRQIRVVGAMPSDSIVESYERVDQLVSKLLNRDQIHQIEEHSVRNELYSFSPVASDSVFYITNAWFVANCEVFFAISGNQATEDRYFFLNTETASLREFTPQGLEAGTKVGRHIRIALSTNIDRIIACNELAVLEYSFDGEITSLLPVTSPSEIFDISLSPSGKMLSIIYNNGRVSILEYSDSEEP